MAHRRTPLKLLLTSLLLAAGVLGGLTYLGRGPLVRAPSPSADWTSPTRYVERPDNPVPPRNLHRMVPDQFDAVTTPKFLTGFRIPNLVVRKDRLDMMVGPATVWSGPYRAIRGFTGRVTIPALAALVARSPHPDWLRPTGPGIYQLAAGLVQAPGTRLEITAPDVRELRLSFQPYVYISGVGAGALFQGVTVTSWVGNRPAPDPAANRPFISYDAGGRLDVVNSEFAYLGTDASRAYGVSWGMGTGGSAVGSVFHHNLFGAYTGGAVGVEFRGNVFRDNARYGLDPHTHSSGLRVVGNEAYGNNTHGIIFSKDVNHSVIEGNRSHDNGANGIMLDERSDHNVIRNNQVWNNRGDGIVLQGSSHAVVSGNAVSGNSVGVRINANELGFTDGSRVANNQLRGNRHGIQVYGGTRDTLTTGNHIVDTADQAINFLDTATSSYDRVSGALKAVVVHRTARIEGLTTSDVGRAVVVDEGARATIEASRLTGKDIAVMVERDGALNVDSAAAAGPTTISGARKAIVDDGALDLRHVQISDVDRGVLVGPGGRATIDTTRITTGNKGVEVQGFNGQGRVQLAASDVRAPTPLVGSTLWQRSGNTLSAIPSWLAVSGALFVFLAAVLQLTHLILVPSAHTHPSPPADPRHRARPEPATDDAWPRKETWGRPRGDAPSGPDLERRRAS
jgi:parallel beta-helix repeat protein